MYGIYDMKRSCYVGRDYGSLRAAQAAADRLDAEYGAVRYQVRGL